MQKWTCSTPRRRPQRADWILTMGYQVLNKKFANKPGLKELSKLAAKAREAKLKAQQEAADEQDDLATDYDDDLMALEQLERLVIDAKRERLVLEAAAYVDISRHGRNIVRLDYTELPKSDPRKVGYDAVMAAVTDPYSMSPSDDLQLAIIKAQLVATANLKDGKQYSKALIGVEFAIAALQWALPRVK